MKKKKLLKLVNRKVPKNIFNSSTNKKKITTQIERKNILNRNGDENISTHGQHET